MARHAPKRHSRNPLPLHLLHPLLLHLLLSSVATGASGGDVGCIKLGACRWFCRTEVKSGTIDLGKIGTAGDNPYPRWDAEPGKDGYSYSYNPCYPYDIRATGADSCMHVIVCRQLLRSQPYTFYNAGTQNSERFLVLHGHQVVVQYRGTGDRVTNVHIVCGGDEPALEVTGEEPGQRNVFWLKMSSRHGCLLPYHLQEGLSVGSILCIIFASLLLVYLVGGVLFLRYCRQAQGAELLPNIDFWSALPIYIKDGCTFTIHQLRSLCTRGEKPTFTYQSL